MAFKDSKKTSSSNRLKKALSKDGSKSARMPKFLEETNDKKRATTTTIPAPATSRAKANEERRDIFEAASSDLMKDLFENVQTTSASIPQTASLPDLLEVKEDTRRHVGQYVLGKTLGKGSFGKVILGTDVFTGENVAIKVISYKNVKEKEINQLQRERNILLRLKHPNIVRLLQVIDDHKQNKCYMVFEYVSGGELFNYIVSHGRLTEADARRIMRQIISAVEYCHSLLIVHRDLKPENLLLDDNSNIKISDFGLSNIMEPGKRFETFCGSLHYACPEILRGEKYLGPGVDVWSMGIILYCLVVGRQPWDGATAKDLIDGILENGLEIPSSLSEDCVDLIVSMLRVSEADRIPISKMRYHRWILEGYDEPPECYLPTPKEIREIDDEIILQMDQMGLIENEEETRKEILANEKTQLMVTYNLLLEQKQEKSKSQKEGRKKPTRRATEDSKPKINDSTSPSRRSPKTKKRTVVTSREHLLIDKCHEATEKRGSNEDSAAVGEGRISKPERNRKVTQSTPSRSPRKKMKRNELKESNDTKIDPPSVGKENCNEVPPSQPPPVAVSAATAAAAAAAAATAAAATTSPRRKNEGALEKKSKSSSTGKSVRRFRSSSLYTSSRASSDTDGSVDDHKEEQPSPSNSTKPLRKHISYRNRATPGLLTSPRADDQNLEDKRSGRLSPLSKTRKPHKAASRPTVMDTFSSPRHEKNSPTD